MPSEHIIAMLEAERARITKAIEALRGRAKANGRRRRRGPLSAAARKKIAEAARKRWAEWRKKKG